MVFSQNAVHAAPRAQVHACVQQAGIDLARRAVLKALAVQRLAHDGCFVRAERARRGRFGRAGWELGTRRLLSAVEPAARHAQRVAGSAGTNQRNEFLNGLHQGCSSDSLGRPRSVQSFFWTAMIVSARSNLACRRTISRAWAVLAAESGFVLGPRAFGARPASVPRARCRRQEVRCEEYRPSRRSNAPIWPGRWQASASLKMSALYSAVNWRRWALGRTSRSGM